MAARPKAHSGLQCARWPRSSGCRAYEANLPSPPQAGFQFSAQEGKPIIAHGGVSFARSLVAQGLVDQFALIVAPVALGKGLPLFSELAAPMRLKLMCSKAFPGGAVAQIYRAA